MGKRLIKFQRSPFVGMSCGVPKYIPRFCLENNCSLCHYHEILKRHWFPDSLQVYKHNSSVNVECQFTQRVQSFALITPVGDWHKQKTVLLCLQKTKTLNGTKMLNTREHTHRNTNFLWETLALASLNYNRNVQVSILCKQWLVLTMLQAIQWPQSNNKNLMLSPELQH